MTLFVIFIDHFFDALRQSSAKLLGHLATRAPPIPDPMLKTKKLRTFEMSYLVPTTLNGGAGRAPQ
jgi:hypothetical protein